MRSSYVLISMAFLLSSCATASIDSMKRDLDRMQRTLADMRTLQAEQTSDIDATRSEIRGLVGRVENLEYLQRAQLGGSPTALADNVNSLHRKDVPSIVPADVLEQDEAFITTIMNPAVSRPFAGALKYIRDGRFNEALPLLSEAYDRNAGADGTLQIVFWRAVALEGMGDHLGALGVYGHIVGAPVNHPRRALALFRQGLLFVKMGDNRTAELTFKKLINDFPQSPEASKAKEKIAELR